MADDMQIDLDLFISMVEERPVLWDKNMELYKNRPATQTAWDEITMTLNPALEHESERAKQGFENILRKKWRYLRDQFSVELGKIPTSLEHTYKPKWPYFKSLLFLKDIVRKRIVTRTKRTSKRANSNASENEADDHGEVPHISFQIEEDSDPLDQEEDEKPLIKKRKYSTKSSLMYRNLDAGESTREDENEEHLYFFQSLLPHIKMIPRRHLLSFRSRIQELVEEYAYSENNIIT